MLTKQFDKILHKFSPTSQDTEYTLDKTVNYKIK